MAEDGWNLLPTHLSAYDARLGVGGGLQDVDLADAGCATTVTDAAATIGDPEALVLSHSESFESSITSTTLDSWERHFAVNARASWLLIKQLVERHPDVPTTSATCRIVAPTSDHVAFNLPYGASKGALDRLIRAAAVELGPRGFRANLINPGPIDTGWMDDATRQWCTSQTPAGRLGTPTDTADLVRFLLSSEGGWINGQLLHSNGGFDVA